MENCKIFKEKIRIKKNKINLNANYNVNINRENNLNVSFGLLNIRSLTSKIDSVYELIHDELDIFVLTESWHGSSSDISLRLAMPPGYSFVDYVRPHDPYHGGLVVFFRSCFKHLLIELPQVKTFEVIALIMYIDRADVILLAIYRPGSSPVCPLFFKELTSVLEHVTILGSYILLAGDFNVHIENLMTLIRFRCLMFLTCFKFSIELMSLHMYLVVL